MIRRRTSVAHKSTLIALAALAALAAATAFGQNDAVPAFKKLDSMEARVQGCVTCHGQSGQGTSNGYFPRIAGKPAGYLYNQLVAFRDGTRTYPPMNYLVAYLPDAYLREIAEHFAKQRPAVRAREAADRPMPRSLARGQALVTRGRRAQAASRRASPATARASPAWSRAFPGWSGCARPTSSAQLTRWRVGDRHAAEPDCMKRIADAAVGRRRRRGRGLAGARRTPPNDPSPESANLVRMPLACGSQR